MHFAVVILVFFLTGSLLAQTPEWGIIFAPVISKGKLPSGVGVVYPGAPFWAGNLIVKERYENGISIEAFSETSKSLRNIPLLVKSSLGYLSCGNFQHYDYDFENSINNIVSIENRFRYITFNTVVKYKIDIRKISVYAGLGAHLGYLIYLKETSRNLVNGNYTQGSFDYVAKERRLNYGPHYVVGGRYRNFSLEGFYRPYYREPNHDPRRVINFGLALSAYLKKSKSRV